MLNVNLIEKFKLRLNVLFRQKKSKSVGIFNKGKGNKFHNNTISGFETGIKDEGIDTEATGNIVHR